jgi:hypothetical protein
MFLLENETGTGAAKLLPAGAWKLSADIETGNAAVVTYEWSNASDGPWKSILDNAGAAISSDEDGGEHSYLSGFNFVRAIATGGDPVSARANPVYQG